MISFIVSVYDRTTMLNACLATLREQDGEHHILVVCNANLVDTQYQVGHVALRYLADEWYPCMDSCYKSATAAVMERGIPGNCDWLCFPSDDSLYVQGFSRIMLATAERTKADLVYCDCVYAVGSENNPAWKEYSVLDVQPKLGRIDKTCFILRRELFKGFPPHPKGWQDGALIEQLVAQGVRHAKSPGVLVLHQ